MKPRNDQSASEYLTVIEYARMRHVSVTTIKRRIYDGVIKGVKTVPGRLPGQQKYVIPRSQLDLPERDLFGKKRFPRRRLEKNELGDSPQASEDISADVALVRQDLDLVKVMLARLERAVSTLE